MLSRPTVISNVAVALIALCIPVKLSVDIEETFLLMVPRHTSEYFCRLHSPEEPCHHCRLTLKYRDHISEGSLALTDGEWALSCHRSPTVKSVTVRRHPAFPAVCSTAWMWIYGGVHTSSDLEERILANQKKTSRTRKPCVKAERDQTNEAHPFGKSKIQRSLLVLKHRPSILVRQ